MKVVDGDAARVYEEFAVVPDDVVEIDREVKTVVELLVLQEHEHVVAALAVHVDVVKDGKAAQTELALRVFSHTRRRRELAPRSRC